MTTTKSKLYAPNTCFEINNTNFIYTQAKDGNNDVSYFNLCIHIGITLIWIKSVCVLFGIAVVP